MVSHKFIAFLHAPVAACNVLVFHLVPLEILAYTSCNMHNLVILGHNEMLYHHKIEVHKLLFTSLFITYNIFLVIICWCYAGMCGVSGPIAEG